MPRSPTFWRLVAGSAALVLAALATSLALASRWVAEDLERQLTTQLTDAARGLEPTARELLRDGLDPAAQGELRRLGRLMRGRITVIDAGGAVVGDTAEDVRAMNNHAQREEIRRARETGGPARAQRTSATLGRRMGYVAVPLYDAAGALVGYVRTARGLDEVETGGRALLRAAGVAAGVGLLLALALAWSIAGRERDQVEQLTRVVEAAAHGDFQPRVRARATGDLGRLGRALDGMSAELERRVETVTNESDRLRAVLSGMVEGVVAIDVEERVVHMNSVATRLLRAKNVDRENVRIWESTRLPEVRDILAAAMREGTPQQGELRLGAGDAQVIEMRAGPLADRRRQVVGAVLLLNDVTELRRLEGIRRDFVANVSHELKTPLTAIRGLIETILDDPEMEAEVRDRFLSRIEEQTVRLSTLVTDLLTLSRLESVRPRVEREVVDLNEVAAASVKRFQGAAEAKSIRLEARLADASVGVLGDEEEMRQMVDNLVDNALKYTPEGGRVTVGLRRVPAREDGGQERCVMEVSDTGIGIEPLDQDRVFERFYRVDKARSRELGGTGLGLAIVKHVALDAGGQVSLESTPGMGSTFRVELPASDSAQRREGD